MKHGMGPNALTVAASLHNSYLRSITSNTIPSISFYASRDSKINLALSINKPHKDPDSNQNHHLSFFNKQYFNLIGLQIEIVIEMFPSTTMLLAFSLLLTSSNLLDFTYGAGSGFSENIEIAWGDGRGKILDNGKQLTLSLDKYSGSGFQSKNEYLFGRLDVQIKLVAGNSAGTVTTFYLSSQGPTHDEIDFEFLGNTSGNPYTLHTNVFAQGKGDREQQFHLWFDPTKDFHTYSILWNPQHIIFLVDNTPIRDFKNHESSGVPFPKNQPMKLYSSLWNADDWATQGGRVKTDWSLAPFTAYYRNFNANACVWSRGASSCSSTNQMATTSSTQTEWYNHELDSTSYRRMRWVQRKFMIYNYCSDVKRFPRGLPRECRLR